MAEGGGAVNICPSSQYHNHPSASYPNPHPYQLASLTEEAASFSSAHASNLIDKYSAATNKVTGEGLLL